LRASNGESMTSLVAVLVIGIGLLLTLTVGMATQFFGRAGRVAAQPAPPSKPGPTAEQQEDIDAVDKGIEEARSELMWLHEQVSRERAKLERLRHQVHNMGNGRAYAQPPPGQGPRPHQPPGGQGQRPQQPAAPMPDSPWVILGLRPGAGPDDIRRRYRLLSRVWHPDRFIDGPPELRAEAEMMMARLNKANNALASQAAGLKR
jgi:DnaJ domain